MQATGNSRALVIIDFELMFDVWSLLCCCVRAAPTTTLPFQSQQEFPTLFHRPVREAIEEFSASCGLDAPTATTSETIFNSFKVLAPSVKPWIPAYQLLAQLKKRTDCRFLLRPAIEPDLIALMPAVGRLQERLGADTVDLLEANTNLVDDLVS